MEDALQPKVPKPNHSNGYKSFGFHAIAIQFNFQSAISHMKNFCIHLHDIIWL